MRKIIFNVIKDALLAIKDENGLSVVCHVDRWNNQLLYAEEEQPFDTPAVFIEFNDILWDILPHGRREATISFNLHVATDSRVGYWSDSVEVFDLLDAINAALHGLHYSDDQGNAIDSVTSVKSSTDNNFDELQDNIETYSAHITDTSALRRYTFKTAGVEITPSVATNGGETD